MRTSDDLTEARIHVLGTGNRPWSVIQTRPQEFELWAALHPVQPNEGSMICIDRYEAKHEALQASLLLIRVWRGVLYCRRASMACRVSDEAEAIRHRFAGMLVELDRATTLMESDQTFVADNASTPFRQLFDVLNRAAKRCRGLAVGFERETDQRVLYSGSIRMIDATSDALKELDGVYRKLSIET